MDDADDAALSGHGDNVKYSLAVWTLWDGYFLSRAIGRNSVTLRFLHLPPTEESFVGTALSPLHFLQFINVCDLHVCFSF